LLQLEATIQQLSEPSETTCTRSQETVSQSVSGVAAIAAADIDGDGSIDIVSGRGDIASVNVTFAWHRNDGTGNFPFPAVVIAEGVCSGNRIVAVVAQDFDGDDLVDVLYACGDHSQSTTVWHRNQGDGFSAGTIITTEATLAYVFSVQVVDMNRDGQLDLLGAGYYLGLGNSRLTWYPSFTSTSLDTAQEVSDESTLGNIKYAQAADLDGDRFPDVVYLGTSSVGWLKNSGATRADRFFIKQTEFYVGSQQARRIASIHAVDLDNDARVDILLLHSDGTGLTWRRNLDQGTFAPVARLATPNLSWGLSRIYTTDIDMDGDMDVFLVGTNTVVWHANEGGGVLSVVARVISNHLGAKAIVAADLDGDGDEDIVVASSANATHGAIVWHASRHAELSLFKAP
jgi:hypothetical protein